MRKTKVKELKKFAILSFASILLITGNTVKAATDWAGVTTESAAGTVTIENDITTNGTQLNLGAPPVPGGVTINGNGHTITAQTPATGSSSYIINNNTTAATTINNTNFSGGVAAVVGNVSGKGGAIQNTAGLNVNGTTTTKSTFSNNQAGQGGAIYNSGNGILTIDNAAFNGNKAVTQTAEPSGLGGAIFNEVNSTNTTVSTIKNSSFTNNTANNYGGAIANFNGNIAIESSTFNTNSTVSSDGGAIMNRSTMTVNGTTFTGNSAGAHGGAIINGLSLSGTADQNANMTISNTTFDGNHSISTGGAIINMNNTGAYVNTLTINGGTTFKNNYVMNNGNVEGAGGAILNNQRTLNGNDGVLVINGTDTNKVVFESNIASSGGAIKNYGTASINNAQFTGNGKNTTIAGAAITSNGGAIANASAAAGSAGDIIVTNSTFTNNVAAQGGAIYNENATAVIIDSDFSGNKATSLQDGGAVYGGAESTTTLRAQNKDMTIGTSTSITDGTDSISLYGTAGTVTSPTDKIATANLQAADSKTLTINSNITGNNLANGTQLSVININDKYTDKNGTTYTSNGTVKINGNAKITNSTINIKNGTLAFAHDSGLGNAANRTNILNLYGGTLDLLNNEYSTNQIQAREFNLLGDSSIKLDVDLGGTNSTKPAMDGILNANFDSITNPGNNTLTVSGMKSISEATTDNVKILFTDAPSLIGHVAQGSDTKIIDAPIHKYAVTQITQNTTGNPSGDNGEYFQFSRIGNSDSVIAGPVAAQGAFLIMDNLYRQSFANMDMVTLMTPEERMAWKMRNKYASAGYHTGVYAPNVIPEERDGIYLRPFTNFENVPLQNGPKVSNVSYGTLLGGDSDLVDLGHGWDGNFSFFGAYHGSHQTYNGVSIWQNGGTLGFVGTAYKGNFWTGVTANAGASAAEATHDFGKDSFPIFMTGAAWKSGYNWGLLNDKFIIQPSYMMSYTFVNVFDYTNGAGVKVTQDPLNAIEIIPGLKLIGNLKNGWQPYLACNMTWNIMDKTKFYADEVALTQLSVKPYFEYGAGLQKRYGDRFTGYGQAMLRNGGRNGIAFTLGLRWALGN